MTDKDLLNLIRRQKAKCVLSRVHTPCTCMMEAVRKAHWHGASEERSKAILAVTDMRLDDRVQIAALHESLATLRHVASYNAFMAEFVVCAQRAFQSPWSWFPWSLRRKYGHEFLRLAREFALEGR